MRGRFAEECEVEELQRQIDTLESDVENLRYENEDIRYKCDKLQDENDGLYDKLDTLNDGCCEIEIERSLYRSFSADVVGILLSNFRSVLKHIDENHPQIIFELMAMPDLCDDINISELTHNDYFKGEYEQEVYIKLLNELRGAY